MKNRDCAGRAVPVSLHADFGFAPPTERRLSVSERPSPAFASGLPRLLSQILPLVFVPMVLFEDDSSIGKGGSGGKEVVGVLSPLRAPVRRLTLSETVRDDMSLYAGAPGAEHPQEQAQDAECQVQLVAGRRVAGIDAGRPG